MKNIINSREGMNTKLTSQLSKFDKRFTERKTTSDPDEVTKCCKVKGWDEYRLDQGDEGSVEERRNVAREHLCQKWDKVPQDKECSRQVYGEGGKLKRGVSIFFSMAIHFLPEIMRSTQAIICQNLLLIRSTLLQSIITVGNNVSEESRLYICNLAKEKSKTIALTTRWDLMKVWNSDTCRLFAFL